MKSQTISKNKNGPARNAFSIANAGGGFTLMEILVTMGMIAMVIAVGSMVDINFYTRELKSSENSTLVSVLQKARNRAMNNISGRESGVYLGDPAFYIIFKGNTYVPNALENEKIPRNINITLEAVDISTDTPVDFLYFNQLSGKPDKEVKITLTDNIRSHEIKILENGLIDW